MTAPLTIEQMILNHNIGVSITNAETLGGLTPEDFAKKIHQHKAEDITSGTVDPQRLPTATSTGKGIVMLSDSVDSQESGIAATSKAVNAIKTMAQGKADTSHKHKPEDITQEGRFPVKVKALNTLATGEGIVRNIFISDAAPTNAVGGDGDIYLQFE